MPLSLRHAKRAATTTTTTMWPASARTRRAAVSKTFASQLSVPEMAVPRSWSPTTVWAVTGVRGATVWQPRPKPERRFRGRRWHPASWRHSTARPSCCSPTPAKGARWTRMSIRAHVGMLSSSVFWSDALRAARPVARSLRFARRAPSLGRRLPVQCRRLFGLDGLHTRRRVHDRIDHRFPIQLHRSAPLAGAAAARRRRGDRGCHLLAVAPASSRARDPHAGRHSRRRRRGRRRVWGRSACR